MRELTRIYASIAAAWEANAGLSKLTLAREISSWCLVSGGEAERGASRYARETWNPSSEPRTSVREWFRVREAEPVYEPGYGSRVHYVIAAPLPIGRLSHRPRTVYPCP